MSLINVCQVRMSSPYTLTLPDCCSIADVATLHATLDGQIAAGGSACRVDCGEVRVIDTATLQTLLAARIFAAANAYCLTFDNPSENFRRGARQLGIAAELLEAS